MNILTAMYTMRKGGAYDRFIMMIEALLERGCEVHCLSLTPISIPHKSYKNYVILNRLGKMGFSRGIVLFVYPLYAVWIGHKENIDRFVAFGTLYAFIESLAKWTLRKPMVTFLRGNLAFGMETQGRSRLVRGLSRWIDKIGIYSSDLVLSVNSTLQEEMRRLVGSRRGQRWAVLPNNIPPMPMRENQDVSKLRKKHGIPEDIKLVVTAGVINCGKNVELLIRSLAGIGADNLFLLVVGDGSTKTDSNYMMKLKKLAHDLALSNRVIFKGWVGKDELWETFWCSDLFILPSKSEGMPNVILEALGCDLPCFGSNIPGIRDILQDDELLFDPWDEKAVSDKIQHIVTDQQFLDRVKRLCHTRKSAFSFDWKGKISKILTSTSEDLKTAAIV